MHNHDNNVLCKIGSMAITVTLDFNDKREDLFVLSETWPHLKIVVVTAIEGELPHQFSVRASLVLTFELCSSSQPFTLDIPLFKNINWHAHLPIANV